MDNSKIVERVRWKDVENFVNGLANGQTFTGVYGLPRGGLVLAVMASHRLGIPLLAAPTKGCLIVDDICDSGESLLHYAKNSSGDENFDYYIATMYYKPGSCVHPDFYYAVKRNNWIVFPWESI